MPVFAFKRRGDVVREHMEELIRKAKELLPPPGGRPGFGKRFWIQPIPHPEVEPGAFHGAGAIQPPEVELGEGVGAGEQHGPQHITLGIGPESAEKMEKALERIVERVERKYGVPKRILVSPNVSEEELGEVAEKIVEKEKEHILRNIERHAKRMGFRIERVNAQPTSMVVTRKCSEIGDGVLIFSDRIIYCSNGEKSGEVKLPTPEEVKKQLETLRERMRKAIEEAGSTASRILELIRESAERIAREAGVSLTIEQVSEAISGNEQEECSKYGDAILYNDQGEVLVCKDGKPLFYYKARMSGGKLHLTLERSFSV